MLYRIQYVLRLIRALELPTNYPSIDSSRVTNNKILIFHILFFLLFLFFIWGG